MVVHAIERGEELRPEIVRRMPRVHPRCGTNIAVGAMIFMGLFSWEWTEYAEVRMLVAGLVTMMFWQPIGSFVQYWFTTKPPTDAQLDGGIRAGKELLSPSAKAPRLRGNVLQRLTASGLFLGKLRNASPEQFQPRETSPIARSDLYSLGLVLYELLTGKHPITGSTPPALIAGHLLNPPLDFATSDPEGRVPAELRAVAIKAMATVPAERFDSAGEFSRALEAVQARLKPDPSALDRALETDAGPTQKIAVPAKTSAQGKLDRHFQAVATPAPAEPPAGRAGRLPLPLGPQAASTPWRCSLEPRSSPAWSTTRRP